MIESQLWQKFKRGDEEAFSRIYHDHYNLLFNYLNKICGNESLSHDCIQDIFLKLWKDRKKLGEVKSIRFYLLASVRRDILRKIKKSRSQDERKNEIAYEQPEIMFSEEEIVIHRENSDEQKRQIAEVLNALPKRQKEAVYLKYYEDLSYEEVAAVMNLNYQSVVNLIYKAFKVLRNSELLKMMSKLQMILVAYRLLS